MEENNKAAKQVDIVVNEIIQQILNQDMRPGEKLPNEKELAKEFGVGRSTLREATRQLESRNILDIRQGSGTYVSKKRGVPEDPLGLTLLYGEDGGSELALELIEARLLVEPEVAAMAACRVTEEQKKELHRRLDAVAQAICSQDDSKNHMEAEIKLHSYIADCCGNSVLKNLVFIVNSSIKSAIMTWDEDLRTSAIKQHEVLIDAICRNDIWGAKYAMIFHLNGIREYFFKKLLEENAKEI